jgi:hypothetical protein
MTIEEKIYQDYVAAMKAKDKPRFDFLNYLRAEIKNAAIAAKKNKLDDNETLTVISKQKKRLDDAKTSIGTASKPEFIQEVDSQINILNVYLPEGLTAAELSDIVAQAIKDTGSSSIKDMGKVMKEVLAKVGVRADSKKVSKLNAA